VRPGWIFLCRLIPGAERELGEHHRSGRAQACVADQAADAQHLVNRIYQRAPLVEAHLPEVDPCRVQQLERRLRRSDRDQVIVGIDRPQESRHLFKPRQHNLRVVAQHAIGIAQQVPGEDVGTVPPARHQVAQPLPEQLARPGLGEELGRAGQRATLNHIVWVAAPVGAGIRPPGLGRREHRHTAVVGQRLVPQHHNIQVDAQFFRRLQDVIQPPEVILSGRVIPNRRLPLEADEPGRIDIQPGVGAAVGRQIAQPAIVGEDAPRPVPRPGQVVTDRKVGAPVVKAEVTAVVRHPHKAAPFPTLNLEGAGLNRCRRPALLPHLEAIPPQPRAIRRKTDPPARLAGRLQHLNRTVFLAGLRHRL